MTYHEALSFIRNKSMTESLAPPEDLLRSAGIKIKTTFGTKFGTEFVLAKKYEQTDIKKALTGYDIKIDGTSVFVMF